MNQADSVYIGLNWLSTGTKNSICKHDNNPYGGKSAWKWLNSLDSTSFPALRCRLFRFESTLGTEVWSSGKSSTLQNVFTY